MDFSDHIYWKFIYKFNLKIAYSFIQMKRIIFFYSASQAGGASVYTVYRLWEQVLEKFGPPDPSLSRVSGNKR